MTKPVFVRSVQAWGPEGFLASERIQYFEWTKACRNRTEVIGMNYTKHAGGFQLEAMGAGMRIDAVEHVLQPLYKKFGVKQTYGDKTLYHLLTDVPGVDLERLHHLILDETMLEQAGEQARLLIEKGALPFFEKYATLEAVSDAINALPQPKWKTLVSGVVTLSVLLIKKMTNAEGYEALFQEAKQFYDHDIKNYPGYFDGHDMVFNALVEDGVLTPTR